MGLLVATHRRRACTGILALAAGVAIALAAWGKPARPAVEQWGPLVIADFEAETLDAGITAPGAKLAVEADDQGDRSLRITLGGEDAGADDDVVNERGVTLPLGGLVLPADGDFSFSARLTSGAAKPVPLRWLALDARGRTVRQAKLQMTPGDAWHDVSVPLHRWRWGNDAVAAWKEVKQFRIVVEGPARELFLDDIVARPNAGEEANNDAENDQSEAIRWLTRIAFGEKPARVLAQDGLLVATDVPAQALRDEDLRRLLAKTANARALVRRLFGDAVRPIDDATPPALLLFAGPDGMSGFWQRAGGEWSANVVPPKADGYTVYDIATSTFDPALGADRPVYLHEFVHAVVAHDVRLLTGTDRHAWLQEGAANYVQLCVYPESLPPFAYPRLFAGGVGPRGGRGLFVPLPDLLDRRVPPRNYAQLASLFAFLADEKPEWIPQIAAALADGENAVAALKRCGTDPAALEAAWLVWGKRQFPPGDEDRATHFPLPPEFETPRK